MSKHVVITGASSGIGRALAVMAEKQQYRLSVCGRNKDKLQHTLSELSRPEDVVAETFCITDEQCFTRFLTQANAKHGTVDILINCAGINNVRKQAYQTEIPELDWMMKVNFYAPIACIKAVLPDMKSQHQGTIVNVLSTVCLFANPGIAAYTATKTALDSFTKVMRKELKSEGIKFLSIYPGGVDTEFRAAERPEYLSAQAVAKAILLQLDVDIHTHIHELVLRPQCEDNF